LLLDVRCRALEIVLLRADVHQSLSRLVAVVAMLTSLDDSILQSWPFFRVGWNSRIAASIAAMILAGKQSLERHAGILRILQAHFGRCGMN